MAGKVDQGGLPAHAEGGNNELGVNDVGLDETSLADRPGRISAVVKNIGEAIS